MATHEEDLNYKTAVNGTDDREAHPKFWVAVYTRSRSEKKLAVELATMGTETYVPVQKQLRNWSDRKKYVEVVVIPMIIFAYVREEEIVTLKKHSLVTRVLSYPGAKESAHIPKAQIERLKKVLGQSETPADFSPGRFSTNDRVTVVGGSLKGLDGEVREVIDDTTMVWVAVDLLGGVTIKIKNKDLVHCQ